MTTSCDRLGELDAERLAKACKSVQEMSKKWRPRETPGGPSRRLADDLKIEQNWSYRELRRATAEHDRVWQEIEKKRGKFLPESWRCGNYDVNKYIRSSPSQAR